MKMPSKSLSFTTSALFSLAVLASTASAQQVLGSSTIGDESGATLSPATLPGTATAQLNAPLPLFYVGGVSVRPHADYVYTRADGVRSASGTLTTTTVETYSLGSAFQLSKDWDADYTHAWTQYTARTLRDSTADFLSLNGRIAKPEWSGTFTQRYAKTDSPLVETGRQTGKEVSDTMASMAWQPAPLWTASIGGTQQLMFIKTRPDYYQWNGTAALNRMLSERLSVGASGSAGYVFVYDASDYQTLSPALQASWQPTRRLTTSAQFGWSYWKSLGRNRSTLDQTTYSVSAGYVPFDNTSISVTAGRGISPSPFRNQVTTSDQLSVNLQQRLFQHLTLQAGITNQRARYRSSVAGFSPLRNDRRRSYDVSLSTRIFRRLSLSGFYGYSRNASGISEFTFSSHQAGFKVGVRF